MATALRFVRRVLRLCLAAALVAACDSATRPSPTVDVRLTAHVDPYYVQINPDGLPVIHCNANVVVLATGNASALWQDGVLRFYTGASRNTALDSLPLTHDEVTGALGGDSLPPGESQDVWVQLHAPLPFIAELELRYRISGTQRRDTAAARFTCGPVPPSGAEGPPTLSNISVRTSGTPLEFGDTLIVSYTASSAYAIWATAVQVSGAFSETRFVNGSLAPSVSHTVRIVVPPAAVMTVPITLTVVALDVAGQQVAQEIPTDLTLTDQTPPKMWGASLGVLLDLPPVRLDGQYAVGDTITITAAANDNHALAKFYFELSGAATLLDSTPVLGPGGGSGQGVLRVPVRAEWVGASTISVWTRDAAGLYSDTVRSTPDGLRVYPLASYPVTTGTAVASNWWSVYDHRRQALYFSQTGPARVGAYSVETMADLPSVALPADPAGADLSPGGDSLIIALPSQKALAIVDLTTSPRAVTTIPLAILDTVPPLDPNFPARPRLLSVAGNGRVMIYMDAALQGNVYVIEHDLMTGKQRLRPDARTAVFGSNQDQPVGATLDRSQLYTFVPGCAQRYVAESDSWTACKSAIYPQYLAGSSADLTGTRFSWGSGVYDAQLDTLRVFKEVFGALAMSPDGSRAFMSTMKGLDVASPESGVKLERISLPSPAWQLFFASDGSRLIALEKQWQGSVRVYRIDLR